MIVDIEVRDPATDETAQARYLAHGVDDVLWTDDLEAALEFLGDSIKRGDRAFASCCSGRWNCGRPGCPREEY